MASIRNHGVEIEADPNGSRVLFKRGELRKRRNPAITVTKFGEGSRKGKRWGGGWKGTRGDGFRKRPGLHKRAGKVGPIRSPTSDRYH